MERVVEKAMADAARIAAMPGYEEVAALMLLYSNVIVGRSLSNNSPAPMVRSSAALFYLIFIRFVGECGPGVEGYLRSFFKAFWRTRAMRS